MNNLIQANWYVAQTKRFREEFAALTVEAIGPEVFLPMARVRRSTGFHQPGMALPLFPGYLFARFNAAAMLTAVESAPGVLRVLKFGREAAHVEDPIIEEIRGQVKADGFIPIQSRELQRGDKVAIQDGPLAGMIGKVLAEPDDKRRVAILLEAMWQARVFIDSGNVEMEAA